MTRDLRSKTLRAGSFVVAGYGMSQVFRLAGNLVLTRLLIPEYFGIMAIANVLYLGIGLLSDIGLEPAVIRSVRAYEPVFLNTAWTLQIARGLGLWILSIVVAFPTAQFYQEPILLRLIPVIGINSIIVGFKSTSLILLSKEMKQGTLVCIEITAQVVSLVCMIVIALISRNIWSLVIGGLVASTLRTIWSHFLRTTIRNRFALERAAARELFSFGKWIFLSTAMMFLATQADRLLLGKLFPMTFFGVYSIAAMLAELPKQVVGRVSDKVVFPLFSKLSHLSREELLERIQPQRQKLLLALALLVGLFSTFGDTVILVLYDQRYEQAAWILPILAVGMWPLILYASIDRSLYVIGKPVYPAAGNLVKFVYMVVGVPLAFRVSGALGVVVAVALNDLPVYVIVNCGLSRERLSLLRQDAVATLALLGIIAVCIAVRLISGLGLPGQAVFAP